METNINQFCIEELSKMEMIQISGGRTWFEWLGKNVGDWLESISVIQPSFITTH